MTDENVITDMEAPIYLNYNFTAGGAATRFLTEIKEGRLVAQRCPSNGLVYMPPRGSCPISGEATTEEVQLGNKATVESFTIVHIPIPGNALQPPIVIANLVPDGVNHSFIHLMSECDNDSVHIGQRVEAVWKPKEEWDISMNNIAYWRPLEEPDVPIEKIGKLDVNGE